MNERETVFVEAYTHDMFDLADPAGAMMELKECRENNPEHYIRISAFDSTKGWETVRLSFIVDRPTVEPGFRLVRREVIWRQTASGRFGRIGPRQKVRRPQLGKSQQQIAQIALGVDGDRRNPIDRSLLQ